MRGFVVFFCYWAVSSAYILRQEKDEEWKTRKTLQNKAYTTERREQTARRTIWTQNLKVRHETVILVTHFYFLLFQWRCTFNLAHIYEKRREDYVAKVRITFQTIGHFTVMDGSEAGVDLVLLQTFLLYYVNQVILMLTSIFQGQFP